MAPAEELLMTWDPRKKAGWMCHHHACARQRRLHAVVRRCWNGHRMELRYCDDHITRMMSLAMNAPGWLDDGSYLGTPLCQQCHAPLELVVERD